MLQIVASLMIVILTTFFAPRVTNYALREHLYYKCHLQSSLMIVNLLLAMVEKPITEVHTDNRLPPSVLSGRVSHSGSGEK
jgi:hypothetical protein